MPATLPESPDYYLFSLQGDEAVFLPMDRAAYARSIFLDRRIQPLGQNPVPCSAAELARAAADAPVGGTGWIFHVAHCGSTLLARALDHADHSLVLREPMPLRRLGIEAAKRATGGELSPEWRRNLRLVAAALARRYRPDAPVVVKANVPVNPIAGDVMALDPDAPAILLYYPLAEYLMAVLRSPGHRQWVDTITGEIGPALAPWCGDLRGLDTLHRAAALWLAQMRIFADLLARYPNARALDAEQMLESPRTAVAGAHRLFGIEIEDSALDAMLAGPLLGTYSKRPDVAFSNSMRRERQAALRQAMAEMIARAREWVAARQDRFPLPGRFPSPLEGTVSASLL